MALIKCYECGKEISDKAISCPNCGAPTDILFKKDNDKNKYNASKALYGFLKKLYLKPFFWIYLITGIIYLLIPCLFLEDYYAFLSSSGRWGYTDYWYLLFTPLIFHLLWIVNSGLSSRDVQNIIVSIIALTLYDALDITWGFPTALLILVSIITGIIMIFKKNRSNWSSIFMWTTIVISILSASKEFGLF